MTASMQMASKALDRAELESLASTEVGGDNSPRGAGSAEIRKPSALPIRPRWSDMCSSDSLMDSAELDEELGTCLESPDGSPTASPKSPTKGARRAQRRRRRREEARAAAALDGEQAALEQQLPGVPAIRGGGVAVTPELSLPAGALMDSGAKSVHFGNCTPTCVASPARGSPTLPISRAGGAQPVAGGSPFMSTAPKGFMCGGDASTRTPTAGACASPFVRGMVLGTDASSRTPKATAQLAPAFGPAWGSPGPDAMFAVVGSPSARNGGIVSTSPMGSASIPASMMGASPCGSASIPTSMVATSPMGSASIPASMMATSPVGSANIPASSLSFSPVGSASIPSPVASGGGMAPFSAASPCAPAGSAAADALRALLGPAGLPGGSGQDLAAKLRAAAPETYED